jgi:hypothetical protein
VQRLKMRWGLTPKVTRTTFFDVRIIINSILRFHIFFISVCYSPERCIFNKASLLILGLNCTLLTPFNILATRT